VVPATSPYNGWLVHSVNENTRFCATTRVLCSWVWAVLLALFPLQAALIYLPGLLLSMQLSTEVFRELSNFIPQQDLSCSNHGRDALTSPLFTPGNAKPSAPSSFSPLVPPSPRPSPEHRQRFPHPAPHVGPQTSASFAPPPRLPATTAWKTSSRS